MCGVDAGLVESPCLGDWDLMECGLVPSATVNS